MLDNIWRHGIAVGAIAVFGGGLFFVSANMQLAALQDAAGAPRWEGTVEDIRREGMTRRLVAPKRVVVLSGPGGARVYEAEITGTLARQIETEMRSGPVHLHISFTEKGFQDIVVAEDIGNQTRFWDYARIASLALAASGAALLLGVGLRRRTAPA